MIKISIVIPVYNAAQYLEICVRSVQKQTIEDLEILCVDDGSTDFSLQILKRLQQEDERIRIFEQSNHGAGSARNLALKNAGGEYVCFLDADDYWLDPEILEKLYQSAVKHNVSICGGQFYRDENGVIKGADIYGGLFPDIQGEKLIDYMDYQYDFFSPNYIYERKLLQENHIEFPNYKRFEDPPFFVKAMSFAGRFCVIDKPFYCYRVGYKKIRYTEEVMADYMQGMLDNLVFSRQRGLKRLHRLTYYRMREACNRGLQNFVLQENAVLFQKIRMADGVIQWKWLEETCRICERKLLGAKTLLSEGGSSEKWILPYSYLRKDSRIALYGAGDVGSSYNRQLRSSKDFSLCAWTDRNYNKIETGCLLTAPEELVNISFDSIVIGVAEIEMAMDIMDKLLALGIPAEKIVWDIGR